MLSKLVFSAILVVGLPLSVLILEALCFRKEPTFTYLGCFTDGGPRVLREGQTSNPDAESFEYCGNICFNAGFALAGVEFGHECYCGNAILYDYGLSESCTTPCPGDASNTCGGSGAIQIYSTGAGQYTTPPTSFVMEYNGWQVTECWEDNAAFGGSRILPHVPANYPPAVSMTVEKCIDACAASTYTSAGLEYGQECWCGNVTYPPGESVPAIECNMACNGNAGEFCGSSNLIIIYTDLNITFPGLF
ncbi:WSC domain-containing protein [Gymnopilus junonius]|uniref:WSC domain-containing protein n=1 Tax=Gymnopilus junonius TaxID=109634 RepID=A0A9P5NZS6_GYMJU|nr:WSC domain-containing protein [Gymnopilus junonius]